MSIETLKAELLTIIETSDFDRLMLMREAAVERETIPDINSDTYWEELPLHVKESLERGIRQSRAGLGIPHEEVIKTHSAWFRTSGLNG